MNWSKLNFLPSGDAGAYIDAISIGMMALLKDTLAKQKASLSEGYSAGMVPVSEDDNLPGKRYPAILQKKFKGRLVYHDFSDLQDERFIYVWDDGLVGLNVSPANFVAVSVFSQRRLFAKQVIEFFQNEWLPEQQAGSVYAITSQGGGFRMSQLGNAGIPLEEGNYDPEVIKGYKEIVADLQSSNPSGRLAIIKGMPGSGKTFLVRAMTLAVPDAMFVLVAPDMVASLAGPELLPTLIAYKGVAERPIILLLEDADKCLVKRGTDGNMNSIQSLLNLGDGIMGSLLDIRIVATTNAEKMEMDKAITRAGRLSGMLDVGPLDHATALGVFTRLLPGKTAPSQLNLRKNFRMSLAEVYRLARKNGWYPGQREKKPKKSTKAQYDPYEDD